MVDVEIAYRNGDANQDRQVPLRKLGDLLDAVIDRPEDRTKIVATINGLLNGIADYQDKIRSIVKPDPSSPLGFSRDAQLRSDYLLLKSDGSLRRTFSVKGIPIRGWEMSLRRPNVTIELQMTPSR